MLQESSDRISKILTDMKKLEELSKSFSQEIPSYPNTYRILPISPTAPIISCYFTSPPPFPPSKLEVAPHDKSLSRTKSCRSLKG